MKNCKFRILSSVSLVAFSCFLSGCAISKKKAPIEYHHRNNNYNSTRNYNEKTVPVIGNDSEIISKSEDLTYKEEEIVKPKSSPENGDKNYVMPAQKPAIQTEVLKKPDTKKLVTKIQEEPIKQMPTSATEYLKPVNGKIISKFGQKTDYGINKGVNISAPEGAKIVASGAGKVIYADYDATFGNLLIIKLAGKNVVVSYAHLANISVAKGATIKQGDVIGSVGSTGKTKQPQLHFAIREGKTAVDPLKFVNYSE